MQIARNSNGYSIIFTPKDLALLLIRDFFTKLFLAKHLSSKAYDSTAVKDYINKLAKESVDSKDYEFFAALLELYFIFEKECSFSFELNNKFNPSRSTIKNLSELSKYKLEYTPYDITVIYKDNEYPFQLKRYRGKLSQNSLYEFIKAKILLHYSAKINYLIIIEAQPYSDVDIAWFKEIHGRLKKEKNVQGYIGFSINHDNKEIITIRVFPKLEQYRRSYGSGSSVFADILNSQE